VETGVRKAKRCLFTGRSEEDQRGTEWMPRKAQNGGASQGEFTTTCNINMQGRGVNLQWVVPTLERRGDLKTQQRGD